MKSTANSHCQLLQPVKATPDGLFVIKAYWKLNQQLLTNVCHLKPVAATGTVTVTTFHLWASSIFIQIPAGATRGCMVLKWAWGGFSQTILRETHGTHGRVFVFDQSVRINWPTVDAVLKESPTVLAGNATKIWIERKISLIVGSLYWRNLWKNKENRKSNSHQPCHLTTTVTTASKLVHYWLNNEVTSPHRWIIQRRATKERKPTPRTGEALRSWNSISRVSLCVNSLSDESDVFAHVATPDMNRNSVGHLDHQQAPLCLGHWGPLSFLFRSQQTFF